MRVNNRTEEEKIAKKQQKRRTQTRRGLLFQARRSLCEPQKRVVGGEATVPERTQKNDWQKKGSILTRNEKSRNTLLKKEGHHAPG